MSQPPRVDAPAAIVTVDGVMDEAVWQQAVRLTDFSQYSPVDGRPADDPTEVFVFYSPTTLYFGIKARAAAGSVHATLANRDRIDADDAIQIFLNPFKDGRQALVFGVNPLGIQSDGALVEGTGNRGGAAFSALESGREVTDLTPDYVFQSKGRVTDDGYEIEIAIPFKTLRFPTDRVQSWALNVVRRIQSSGREDSWTPALRAKSSFLSQSGTLDGLTDLRRGLVLDLNPVATAHSDGLPAGGGWNYTTSSPEFGGNVRWGVTPNLTLNGTVNPDFSQVEADASQFTFDPRSALFFPEKRPFFLDGAELFNAPNNLIYTRRIAAPLTAIKLTGKSAGTDIALLSAVDDPATSASGVDHPVFTIARIQHDLPRASKVGFVYTDRIDGANSNRVFAADARLLFGSIYNLQLQAGGSRTVVDGRATTAPIWAATFNRDGRHFGLRYQTTGIHQDFQAASGFISRGGVITTNLTHRATWFGADRRAAAELDHQRPGQRRQAVPQRGRHAARGVAGEEAALQQQLQVPRRVAGRRVGAVRIVRVRRAVLSRTTRSRRRRRSVRRSCRSPASRSSTTTTTSSRSTRRSSRGSRAACSTSGDTTRISTSGRRRRSPSRPTRSTGGRTTSFASARSTSCSRTTAAATGRPSASDGFRG